MGYTTSYELDVIDGDVDLIGVFVDEYEGASYALTDCGDTYEECEWYDHNKDLMDFSLKHPETVFQLTGVGEESGDIWAEYYQNGQVQHCEAKITFDDFDPKQLK